MRIVCPECKNDADLSAYPNLEKGQTLECNHCGISLVVAGIREDEVFADVADEGK